MSNQFPTNSQAHADTPTASHGKVTILAAILAATLASLIALRGHSVHTENLYALIDARPTWIIGCIPFVVLLLSIAIVPMIPAM